MNTVSDKTDRIAAEAAEWFTRLREDELGSADRQAFEQWLAESPVHVREYLAIAQLWGQFQAAQPWPTDSTENLMAAARAQTNVMPLAAAPALQGGGLAVTISSAWSRRKRVRATSFYAAAAVVMVVIAAIFALRPPDFLDGKRFTTVRGEQRSLVLEDGSVVQLNTLSRLTVRFSAQRRTIELADGEAFFRVAHEASRPFEVITPLATVRAIGTEFNVYSREHRTQVAVVEGSVQVAAHGLALANHEAPEPLALTARQAIDIDASGRQSRRALAKPDQTISWIQRRLTFDNDRLDHIVEEFNRYNARHLQVSDPVLAALRISGVFNADDPDALTKYLKATQRVRIVRQSDTSSILQQDR